ncbi:MAG TPA: hypothetical protein VF700_02450 [Segetibacter sp.]
MVDDKIAKGTSNSHQYVPSMQKPQQQVHMALKTFKINIIVDKEKCLPQIL